MLSKIRGNKAEVVSQSEEATHASLVCSFYVLGRETVEAMMDEADVLGSEVVTRMMANK